MHNIQGVPLATEPGISLIILTPMKILQRNLNRGKFVVCEMKRNVCVVCVSVVRLIVATRSSGPNMPGSIASGKPLYKNRVSERDVYKTGDENG
jgi:hypothetical protein